MAVVFPPNPALDETVTGTFGEVYTWDGVKWTLTANGASGGGASVEVGPTPPVTPASGNLWWDTVGAQLYLWDGAQWVVVVNQPAGAAGPEGPAGPPGATGPQGPAGTVPPGVTNGSNAAPGSVGEYLTTGQSAMTRVPNTASTSLQQITLTPGDWDVTLWFTITAANPPDLLTSAIMGLSTSPNAGGSIPSEPYWYVQIFLPADVPAQAPFWVDSFGPIRYNVSAATTLYLVTFCTVINNGGGQEAMGMGMITARRMR